MYLETMQIQRRELHWRRRFKHNIRFSSLNRTTRSGFTIDRPTESHPPAVTRRFPAFLCFLPSLRNSGNVRSLMYIF